MRCWATTCGSHQLFTLRDRRGAERLADEAFRRQNPTSKYYDYRLIYERLQAIIEAREDEDVLGLVNLLRSGLVRNLGNITAPRLFNRAFAGTKLLIEDYVTQVAYAIEYVTDYPTSPGNSGGGLTSQAKLDVLHDTRQAFGRSALVLQGGSIFGLCHIGVVKAMHLRGLLPRIIAGTATGALIAALVGIHTEEELLGFLTGEGLDLTAFTSRSAARTNGIKPDEQQSWWKTLVRRTKRFLRDGYFLDVSILEQCVRANVGDLTFAEAYARTKRVLNITISTSSSSDAIPSVLNYLTAPHVLIWSAALASNASSAVYSPVPIVCKAHDGSIIPWAPAQEPNVPRRRRTPSWPHSTSSPSATPRSPPASTDRDTPLARIAELFNVNHFIVSQARPYIVPFLTSDLHHSRPSGRTGLFSSSSSALFRPLSRLIVLEINHRLHQLDTLNLLPASIRRFLLDENIPGNSLTLVPEIQAGDFVKLLENPTPRSVEYWIQRGEKSVWPAIGALKVRCAVEVELDRGYQLVRRRKPMDVWTGEGREEGGKRASGDPGGRRKRTRASSMGGGVMD